MQQNADFVVFVESSTERFIEAAVYYQYFPSFPILLMTEQQLQWLNIYLADIQKWATADEFR